MEILKMPTKSGRMNVTKNGFPICPVCRRPMHGVRILHDTAMRNAGMRCKQCKRDFILNVESGQCVYTAGARDE